MKKSYILCMPKLFLALLITFFMVKNETSAQSTNPAVQSLPYTFNTYTGSSFPASLSVGLASTTNLSTADFTANAPYGTSTGQWKDEGSNGISYQGSSSNESGCFKVRMNTTGLSNISVAWTGRRISNSSFASSYLELQWRNGNSGSWNNVSNDQFDSDNSSTSFSQIMPAGANNLSDLQIRWILYDQSYLFGNRDRVSVDDITICAAPVASASNNGPICSGTALNLSSTPAGMTYAWTGPNGFTSTAQNPTIASATTAADGVYTVVVTNAGGCSVSTTTDAQVNGIPNANAGSNSPVCVGNTLNLTSSPGSGSYQWSGPSGYTSTSQNPTRSNANATYAGVYTVTVTVAGCSSSSSTTVNINSAPSVSASNNGPVCAGTSLALSALPAGGTYQWSGPNGYTSTSQNPNISNSQTTHTGTYTVTVTVGGCSASTTTAATVNAAPQGSPVATASSICEGAPFTLSAGMVGNNTTVQANTTDFNIPDNNLTGVSSPINITGLTPAYLGSASIASVNFNINHSFDRDLRISLKAPNGAVIDLVRHRGGSSNNFTNTTIVSSGGANGNVASGSAPFNGIYNSETPFSQLNAGVSNGNYFLVVRDTEATDTGVILDWTLTLKNATGLSYTWTSNPSGFTSTSEQNTTSLTSNTTYTVVATLGSCSTTGNVTVNAIPAPVPVANSNAPVCQGIDVNFSGNNAASGQTTGNSYQWTGPNGFSSSQQNPAITNPSAANNGTYSLTITNQFLCTATTTTGVTVNANPVLNLALQTNVSCNGYNDGSVTLIASGGSSPYLFTDNNTFLVDNSTVTFGGYSPGGYSFMVIDANNCDNSMQAPGISATITEPDVLAFTLSGVDELCPGFTNGSITLNATGGTLPYQYSSNNGTSYQAQNVFNNLSPGLYNTIVNDDHNCLTFPQQITLVTTYTASFAPSAITTNDDNNEICLGGSIVLTQVGGTLSDAPGSAYVWRENSCTGQVVGTGNSITVSPVATTNYYVGIESICGNTSCALASVAVTTSLPSSSVVVPPIAGMPLYACNGTVSVLSVPVVNGATQYIWDGPTGTTFNSSGSPHTTNSPTVTITFGNPNGSGYHIGVQAANACGTTFRKSQWARGVTSVPAGIIPASGLATVCPSTSASFSCPPITGATSYLWTITGNASIIGSGNTATVNFDPSWTGGQICVSAQTPCYTSPAKCLNLGLNVNPTAVPHAQGVFTVCPGSTQTYSVNGLSGVLNYAWTLPAGASGSSTTNSINVTFGSGFINGNLCYTATSICGVTTLPRCKTVTVGSPSTPSSITGPSNGLCGQTIAYSCPPQSGAAYNWTLPSGASGSSNSNSIAITFPSSSFTTASVCVQASNACGSSGTRCVTVKGAPNTPAAITSIPGAFCANTQGVEFMADINNISGSYALDWSWLPASAANYVIGQGTNDLILDWNASNATVSLKASNGCGSGTKTFAVSLTCREANPGNIYAEEVVFGDNSSLVLYPNPASDVLNLELSSFDNHTCSIQLIDLTGRVVIQNQIAVHQGFNKTSLDVSNLAKGAFLVKITNGKNVVQKRIIIQ